MMWRLFYRLIAVAVLPLFVVACAQTPGAGGEAPSAPPPPEVDDTQAADDGGNSCRLDDIQSAVGSPLSETSREALKRQSGAEKVRVLRPGDAATLDHRPERLNIHLNDNDAIEEVSCG
ncbi:MULTISPECIES: I78 family peptidase inhibitor [unclassified Halomonas]|uniref:I78 family peptidase inhibitor n=1 Tax=unclassified Halomonas TaxID=2609666 RepID=UPI0006DB14A7|nr:MULTISPECIES: I78 family peptidase inhibitor [unclassified Halomonas]KPQ20474.1 MAG: Peptidase inhibitor I78 family [Halomonas sp. HL-93]SBR46274.1 Peptidase inhibitor I78 family protein [Halomonas sp. HL-93]SNY98671.1 Peptidase inhibitor I78 family protein [Halomonas sp. hl-4]